MSLSCSCHARRSQNGVCRQAVLSRVSHEGLASHLPVHLGAALSRWSNTPPVTINCFENAVIDSSACIFEQPASSEIGLEQLVPVIDVGLQKARKHLSEERVEASSTRAEADARDVHICHPKKARRNGEPQPCLVSFFHAPCSGGRLLRVVAAPCSTGAVRHGG